MNLHQLTLKYLGWCPSVESAARFVPDREIRIPVNLLINFSLILATAMFSVLIYASAPWEIEFKPIRRELEVSFTERVPYTLSVESPRLEQGYEIVNLGKGYWYWISVVVEYDYSELHEPSFIPKIVCYDKTNNEEVEGIKHWGGIIIDDLNPKHEYDIRITSSQEGLEVSGHCTSVWEEVSKKMQTRARSMALLLLGLATTLTMFTVRIRNLRAHSLRGANDEGNGYRDTRDYH